MIAERGGEMTMTGDDEGRFTASTHIEITPDGRVIIRAEIGTTAQLRALKNLIDSFYEQGLLDEQDDPGGNDS